MDPSLIIKPTELCNFKCTFCSSTDIQKESENLGLESIKMYLKRYPNTPTIIVNGGDPLMMKPKYYFDLLEIVSEFSPNTIISFTSNLWAFYKKPKMWEDIFRHPNVNVVTSFQYGNSRLKGDLSPFTEQEFWSISDMFLDKIGYRPDFISVTTKENENYVLKTVELAKKMDVECKVNHAVASGTITYFKGIRIGNQDSTYLLSDMYSKYIEIYEHGLAPWEHNTKSMLSRLGLDSIDICPQNINCDESIRCLQPGDKYYSCGSFGDDDLYPIDFNKEVLNHNSIKERPLSTVPELMSLKMACFECPMFKICNGCKKTIHDLKKTGLVEKHCVKMKTLADKIIKINKMSNELSVTNYINESI